MYCHGFMKRERYVMQNAPASSLILNKGSTVNCISKIDLSGSFVRLMGYQHFPIGFMGAISFNLFIRWTSLYHSIADIKLRSMPGTLYSGADQGSACKRTSAMRATVVKGEVARFSSSQYNSFVADVKQFHLVY